MRYKVTTETAQILDHLIGLRDEAGALLAFASPAARQEWRSFESRFPSRADIRQGFIALSEPELADIRSKTKRFRDILASRIKPIGPN